MKHRIAATLLALLGVCSAHARDWNLLESEHFRLYTVGELAPARSDLKQMEAFRWLAMKLLGADEGSVRAQIRFDMFILPGTRALQDLHPGLPDQAAGVYSYCSEGAIAHGARFNYVGGNEDWGLIVMQHEYAHHLMFQYATISYPAWYVEGFAEFLATATYEDGRLALGESNRQRQLVLERSTWLTPEELLGWDAKPAKDRSNTDRDYFYAQSWLLTHYMLSDDERSGKLNGYFARVAAGEDPVAAFEPATGIALAELDKRLQQYRRHLHMLRIDARSLPEPAIRNVPLDDDADTYLPESSRLRTCASKEQGAAMLDKLRRQAKAGGGSQGLRLTLARAELLFGSADAAQAILEPLVAADDASAEGHYLLGRVWTRRAEGLTGDAAQDAQGRARAELIKAYRLKKDDAPTLYYLARALSRDRVDSNVLNAARGARALAPAVPEYAAFAAWAELQAGDRERARRALLPMASNPHNPARAARARQAIEAIQAGKSAADVSALLGD